MQYLKASIYLFMLLIIFISCASTDKGSVKQGSRTVKTISVETFDSLNSVLANDVRNIVVEDLLSHYSVVIGDKADVSIKGAIEILDLEGITDNKLVQSISGEKRYYISEINAQILRGQEVIELVNVKQDKSSPQFPYSSEIMGNKLATRINEVLSKH